MKTGEICQQFKITRDTLRHYIKHGLLNPTKDTKDYQWSDQDIQDLSNILQLRELGLSIQTIKQIKDTHDKYCGTLEQWVENKAILEKEVKKRDVHIKKLEAEKEQLLSLIDTLNQHIISANTKTP